MRNLMVGDRFKSSGKDCWVIWEILEVISSRSVMGLVLQTKGDLPRKEGDVDIWVVDPEIDSFIGNFDKSKNFNSLYEKLQGN